MARGAGEALGTFLGRAITSGLQQVRDSRIQRRFVDEAAGRIEAIGSEEALGMAGMLRESPEAADFYVRRMFGGWDRLYSMMKAEDLRRKTAETAQQAQSMTEDDARRAFSGLVVEGLDPKAAEYLATAGDMPEWFKTQIARDSYDNLGEAIEYGRRTNDWTGARDMLVPTKRQSKGKQVRYDNGMLVTYDGDTGVPISSMPVPGTRGEIAGRIYAPNEQYGGLSLVDMYLLKKAGKKPPEGVPELSDTDAKWVEAQIEQVHPSAVGPQVIIPQLPNLTPGGIGEDHL